MSETAQVELRSGRVQAPALGACLTAAAATHVLTTPTLLGTIQLPQHGRLFPSLRVVALGGEPMPRALVGPHRPISVYRLAETPIQSCGQSVSAPRGKAGASWNAHTALRAKRLRGKRYAEIGLFIVIVTSWDVV